MTEARPDGRSANSLRPLSCELGCLQAADGSALWKAGNTHVLAAVHGPIAPRIAMEEHAEAFRIQVVIQTSSSNCSEWEAFLTRILTSCCCTQLYPRCILSITIHVLSHDGSILAAALHAAVSALMDAGIEMRTLPVGVTCLLLNPDILLDPTQVEEDESASLMLVLENSDADQILACYSSSSLNQSIHNILKCSVVAARVSQAISAFWRIAVESKVKRQCETIFS
ncbi:exosome complex component RRP46 [Fistulifera solaris]|uniref:Exosome complex component RRP46 n=1 Tax=Fistulifera solaris TaxID=1519565 RepID=A0A1Z5KKJ6_FISSO|nr:exosome complex component RRP46 [Fistulifera solaris]|eukprot:GAX26833.1 exosome complex component RRP46 [Fistulifera solaris]